MALRGDAIDNIPGAPGIGDKGSVELIKRFGSVEATLDHAEEIERKTYRESLLNNRDVVLTSKVLATIDTQVPVTLDLETMVLHEPDAAAARELFSELEFTSLLKDFLPAVEIGTTDYRDATSSQEVEAALKARAKETPFAVALEHPGTQKPIAVETTEEDEATENEDAGEAEFALQSPAAIAAVAELPKLERVAISAQPGKALAIALASPAGQTLSAALADPEIPKAVHDYKSVLHDLAGEDRPFALAAVRDDPMLFSYLLDPTYSSHTLPEIALRRFNLKLSGSLAEAADITGRLATTLRGEVEAAGLIRLYERD